MFNNIIRKIVVYFVCYVLVYSPLINADQLSFPSGDMVAPKITQSEYNDTVIKGGDHEITVKVTDNVSVKQVVLYYKVIGSEKFNSRLMNNVENTDSYKATIKANEIKKSGIEYYIQAEDNSSNTVLHGHSFSPLSVGVIAERPDLDTLNSGNKNELSSTSEDDSIFTNKWLWIGIGVLVAGVAASSGGGGGGGGGDTGVSGATLNINTLEPATN